MSKRMSNSESRIAELLQTERADSFSPFFVNRVMKRVGALSSLPGNVNAGSLYDALRWVFVRAAVAALVLIIAVGLLNALDFGVAETASWVDALLGLPSDELADMLTYETI